jgi:hypothetical protein
MRTVNSFAMPIPPPAPVPRAFSGYAFDKSPYIERIITFRFILLGLYCNPDHFNRLIRFVEDYANLENAHSVLSMMTLIGEYALPIFIAYRKLKMVQKLKERLQHIYQGIDLNENFEKIEQAMRKLGKTILARLVMLIRTEENTSVLSVAQLTMTTTFLRALALEIGPLDTDEPVTGNMAIPAMEMAARLAFEGLATQTKRKDIFEWTVNWFKRQMELDFTKHSRTPNVGGSEAVGFAGIQ